MSHTKTNNNRLELNLELRRPLSAGISRVRSHAFAESFTFRSLLVLLQQDPVSRLLGRFQSHLIQALAFVLNELCLRSTETLLFAGQTSWQRRVRSAGEQHQEDFLRLRRVRVVDHQTTGEAGLRGLQDDQLDLLVVLRIELEDRPRAARQARVKRREERSQTLHRVVRLLVGVAQPLQCRDAEGAVETARPERQALA